MIVLPAIDLLDGKAVRLRKGLREECTVYSEDPPSLVASLIQEGAERIHVVDLNGAFSGCREHSPAVAAICQASSVPVQVGGGIRNLQSLEACFADGASYAVLGTAAIKSPDFVREACQSYPGKIVVAVDAKKGMVAVEGWVETSDVSAQELAKRAADWGAGAILYTDVDRDGMHTGPNVEATAKLSEVSSIPVIASGGVSSLDDLRALKAANIPMVITGKALYDKHFTLAEAISVSR